MGEFVLKHNANGVWYGVFTDFAAKGVTHGVSTRLGGCSNQPFAGLNLGLHTGDDAGVVWHNRQTFCQALGFSAENAVTAEQVHSDVVQLVTQADTGRGSRNYTEAIKNTDALITNVPAVPLMLFFADCVPVLIYDPIAKAIGISHAGWKGTVAKIAQKTVLAMQHNYGSNPADCLVGIGPSIGPCCYEVDEAVMSKLRAGFAQWEQLAEPCGDRWRLNLWATNRQQLREIGVKDDNITDSGICTADNTSVFFSHRAESGHTGRLGAVIML